MLVDPAGRAKRAKRVERCERCERGAISLGGETFCLHSKSYVAERGVFLNHAGNIVGA